MPSVFLSIIIFPQIADLNSSCDTLRGQVEALTTEKRLMSQIYQDQIGMLLAKIQLKEDILKGEITDRNYKVYYLCMHPKWRCSMIY